MNTWGIALIGAFLALVAQSFGALGNLFFYLIFFGSAHFLFFSHQQRGGWYLTALALTGGLVSTDRFGIHLLVGVCTYTLYYILLDRLRFTAPANRRTIAITATCLIVDILLARTISLGVCLITLLSLIILISVNYLIPDQTPQLRYANS